MNKIFKILMVISVFTFLDSLEIYSQEAENIQELFLALKSNPQTKNDSLAFENAKIGKQLAYSALYPKITTFGTYNNYSTPTGMLPVPPNEMFPMIQDSSIPQPFSEDILRAGVSISMPVFIKSIYTMANKAKYIQKSAKAKQYINLLQNEAIIVSSNANLQYIESLSHALEIKKQSLLKTKEIVAIQVNNGRAPGSSLLVIQNVINQVDATINDIAINRETALASIKTLTGIRLNTSVEMIETASLDTSEIKSLEPIQQKVLADKLSLRAEKEKLLPSILLIGNYNHSFANAYNNNRAIDKNYTDIGLVVSLPIFNKSQYSQIKKSNIEYSTTQNEYDKMRLAVVSQAEQFQKSLQLLYKSEKLYQQNVKDKEAILAIAKVSFQSGRITIEDYLKYEDDLVLEKSKLYKAEAEKWQTLVKLAVIYGNNIENLVK
ncbi:TolC family protein [Yeosuana marina]|uniref:TolC family protein n=1 Tax=Yeosuana marina TaxID=1565536 RepID=UPI00141E91FD|nr:TolC family protein [Yeosuana marina]